MTGFVLRAAVWFVVFLAFWFWAAPWLAAPVNGLAGAVMRWLFSGWVEAIERTGTTLELVTSLPAVSEEGRVGSVVLDTSYLRYAYGLPMFPALILASRARRPFAKILIGGILLMPFQAWGICFESLQQALFLAGPLAAQRVGFVGWQIEAVVLGYQLGSLALPTVTPVLMWLALDRRFAASLFMAGWLTEAGGKRE